MDSFYTGNLPHPPAFSTDPFITPSSSSSAHAASRRRPIHHHEELPHPPLPPTEPPRLPDMSSFNFSRPPPSSTAPPPHSNQAFHFQPRPHQPQLQPTHNGAPQSSTSPTNPTAKPTNFDVIDWSQAYASCQRYFLDHGQHESGTQAMAALINILLPFQWRHKPVHNSSPPQFTPQDNTIHRGQTSTPPEPQPGPSWYFPRNDSNPNSANPASLSLNGANTTSFVSLIPYLRRMVVTGYAVECVLYGLFGTDYKAGILPLIEIERRNYLFTAKSVGWARTKKEYDMEDGQSCPFLNPLEDVSEVEIGNAEGQWGRWLAMEDWYLGERVRARAATNEGRTGRGSGTGPLAQGGMPMDERERDEGVRIKRERPDD